MMRWLKVFYSFTGEIERWEFWVGFFLSSLPAIAFANLMESYGIFEGPLVGVFVLLFAWPLAALAVKRARARNRPLWWLWFGLVPYVGQIWFIWEFAARPGRVEGPAPVGLWASFKHARNVKAQLPEVIRLEKTAGLPKISEDDILASGLNEDVVRQLGLYEREKHVYKGSDPGKFLGNVKGYPFGYFLIMNKGLVFLDKGPQHLTAGKALEIVFDKTVGGIAPMGGAIGGAIGGLATGLVSSLSQKAEEKDAFSKSLAEYKSRPGTFIIPYTEIIEVRHVKHSFADTLLNFKRQAPDGSVEEYWLRPTDKQYPFLLMSLRASAEKALNFENLLSERSETSTWLPQMIEDFRKRHPNGGTPDETAAFEREYLRVRSERLKAKSTSFVDLLAEAGRRTEAAFAGTPVYAVAAAIESPQAPAAAVSPQAPNASNDGKPSKAAAKTIVKCPSCRTELRLPAGKRGAVKCPKCTRAFEATT